MGETRVGGWPNETDNKKGLSKEGVSKNRRGVDSEAVNGRGEALQSRKGKRTIWEKGYKKG